MNGTAVVKLIIIGMLLSLTACINPWSESTAGNTTSSDSSSSDRGALHVHIAGAIGGSSILQPELGMAIASYTVQANGPGEAAQSVNLGAADSSAQFTDLAPGSWMITVNARNEGDVIIASASESVDVTAGETASTSLTVVPLIGEGTLSLAINWPVILDSPTITGTLTPSTGGTAESLSFTHSGNGASYEASWPAGYYDLSLSFQHEGEDFSWNRVVAVRIIQDELSSGTYYPAEGAYIRPWLDFVAPVPGAWYARYYENGDDADEGAFYLGYSAHENAQGNIMAYYLGDSVDGGYYTNNGGGPAYNAEGLTAIGSLTDPTDDEAPPYIEAQYGSIDDLENGGYISARPNVELLEGLYSMGIVGSFTVTDGGQTRELSILETREEHDEWPNSRYGYHVEYYGIALSAEDGARLSLEEIKGMLIHTRFGSYQVEGDILSITEATSADVTLSGTAIPGPQPDGGIDDASLRDEWLQDLYDIAMEHFSVLEE